MPYPAKVLLLGEHTVLRGGRGLAVPYPRLSLRWTSGDRPDARLGDFAHYLRAREFSEYLAVTRLSEDVREGVRLVGDIPTGYGLGSSGAVCAAVYDRYRTHTSEELGTRDLRHLLARMEGHFHGQSSGTDPLVSYLQRPLLLEGGDTGTVQLPNGWQTGFFLVDTGITRRADNLIARFLRAFDAPGSKIRPEWMAPVETAIDALLANDREALHSAFAAISRFQLTCFPDFIPSSYHTRWEGEGAYRLKLCGAGGGGMLLGLSTDATATEAVFKDKLYWL